MALYDYACDACKTRFEVNHPMSAPPVQVCPTCGEKKVRKILSTGGIGTSNRYAPPAPPPCATGGCGSSGMCGMA